GAVEIKEMTETLKKRNAENPKDE
ncbi:MAG: hypothetical protein JWM68_3973, partial [Verrucomicrobiales bacterium]|nr:hypothetical protein [Verrucomicrobiales bacterium]